MSPISEIKTIEHMIFYQYAKIMAKSAFGHKDGKEAKAKNFGFIILQNVLWVLHYCLWDWGF